MKKPTTKSCRRSGGSCQFKSINMEVSCKYSLSRGFSISLSCRTQKLLSKILDWTVDDDPLKRFHWFLILQPLPIDLTCMHMYTHLHTVLIWSCLTMYTGMACESKQIRHFGIVAAFSIISSVPWHPDELESRPKMPTKRTTHLIYDDLKTSNSGFQHVQKHIHYII